MNRRAWLTVLACRRALTFPAAAGAQSDRSVFRVVPHLDLEIVDPIWTTAYITRDDGYMIPDTLFGMDAEGQISPQIVEKWEASKDKRTWTFTLGEEVKLHDGRPVSSEDIIASLALGLEPEVLITDEAVYALDVLVQAQTLGVLDELQRRLVLTLVFITHDLRVAAQICNRIVVLQGGRIIEQEPVAQVFESPRHPYTRALIESAPGRGFDFGVPADRSFPPRPESELRRHKDE